MRNLKDFRTFVILFYRVSLSMMIREINTLYGARYF